MKEKKLGMEIEIFILMNDNKKAVVISMNENQIPTLWETKQYTSQ